MVEQIDVPMVGDKKWKIEQVLCTVSSNADNFGYAQVLAVDKLFSYRFISERLCGGITGFR